MIRPDWDTVWIKIAETVSDRSLCTRAQVGAVIVSADNRVQAITYNGPPPDFQHMDRPCTDWCPRSMKTDDFDPEYNDCFTGHAEANAISRSNWSELEGATLYVTTAVCFNCSKLIGQTGIRRVVYVAGDDEHRRPDVGSEFLRSLGKRVDRV